MIDSVQLSVGNRSLITDLYLSCSTGDIVGIYGRNGSGKSMLFKSIFGVHTPQQIYIAINDKRINKPYLQPGLIGYLPQFLFIPTDISLRQLFRDYDCDRDRFLKYFPDVSMKEARKLNDLTTGQIRLVEFYLIITGRCKFVLLDEPFTYIAPVQIEKLQQIILEERTNKGILITDHQHHYVKRVTDRNYVLDNGALHEMAL
jgi:ABC-type lipopolysaccharide export system ATPase subunit